MNKFYKKSKKAFSLIEILIILVIVSVSVLAAVPITTNKTSFSTWKRDNYNNIEYVAYGHDLSSNDRVGINVDPYKEATKGKLATDIMGVAFEDNGDVNYNTFIFGGIEQPANTFLPDAPAAWGGYAANLSPSLIIGRNYDAATAYNGATIISSFAMNPGRQINGTCIGNVLEPDQHCLLANDYDLNDTVFITNATTTFVNPADSNHTPITVTATGVTTSSNGGLVITGDLYALYPAYFSAAAAVACDTSPCVRMAQDIQVTDDASLNNGEIVYYKTFTADSNQKNYLVKDDSILYNNQSGLNIKGVGTDVPQVEGSDIRLKNVLKPYTKGIDYIAKIKTHYYTFKNDVEKKLHAGIIAQEIIGIFDEALEKTKDGFYSYKKSPFLYAMVNSVKSLYSEQQDILKEQEELLKMVKKG